MSLALRVRDAEVRRLRGAVAILAAAPQGELLDVLGAVVVSQTQRRLSAEKRGPDGAPWPAWSPAYAATRNNSQSLLMGSGHLDESIQHLVRGDEVEIGSNLVYAAIHQFGGADAGKPEIPARPYLGISDDDAAEILDVVDGWTNDLVADMERGA